MSRRLTTNKPYCKVCHDAGKPEKEYTNHRLKDRNGKTTCPTLLKTECRFCHKLGHMAKFCDAPKKKEKIEYKPKEEKKPVINSSFTNKFQSLSNDDDEEEESVMTKSSVSWADIACKPPAPEIVEEVSEKDYVVLTDKQTLLRNMYRRNWAEWPDSEDDE
jgi:hypothetical protein